MYNLIQSKLFFIPVILGGCILAMTDHPIFVMTGAVIVYGTFAILMITAIFKFGVKRGTMQAYLIDKVFVVGVCSLGLVPAIYFADAELSRYDGMTKSEIRSERGDIAGLACREYFEVSAFERIVGRWDHKYCEAFPEYNRKAKFAVANSGGVISQKPDADQLWK